jgi:hypothetical protein
MLAKAVFFCTAILAILCGWFQLARFSATPGEQSPAPALLPANVLGPDGSSASHLPLLLVFIHPQCSCTVATLQQLNQLLDNLPRPVEVVLAVYDSVALHGQAPINSLASLHHPFRTLTDGNGRLARRFGAATSGEILLYSATRQLLFQGGITPERAHAGDSPGAQALRAALVSGKPSHAAQSSVFGCPIFHLGWSKLGHTG